MQVPRSLAPLLSLVLVALAALASFPPAQGQLAQNDVGPYTVQGQVETPEGEPASQAHLTLLPADSDGGERETEADPQGSYRFTGLPEGSYHLLASHECCGPSFEPVAVDGMETPRTVDLVLADQPSPEANVTLVLYGWTEDLDTGEVVPETLLTVGYLDREGHRRHVDTRSDEAGTYAVEIRPRQGDLEASKDGHDLTRAEFSVSDGEEVRGERELSVPLRPSEDEAARISGRVLTPAGGPLEGARVQASPAEEDCRHECPRRAPLEHRGERVERNEVTFWIQPTASRYDHARSAEDGSFTLTVLPGTLTVRAQAPNFVRAQETLDLSEGEHRSVNLTLDPIPDDSVEVRGTLTDARTGEAVENAIVQLQNHRWGGTSRTHSADDGSFALETKPGFATLRAHTEDCVRVTGVAVDASRTSASPTPRETRPHPPCEDIEREVSYFPRSTGFLGEANTRETIDLELTPRPGETATIQGWVLDALDGQALQGARVFLENELTGERGLARTDANGSYAVDVTPGYYTVHARAEEHFPAVGNLQVGPEATRNLVLEAHPGTPHRRSCCYSHAVEDGAATSASGGPQGKEVSSREAGDAGSSSLAFQSSGGGLGPYDPTKLEDGGPMAPTPAPGPASVLVLSGIAMAIGRRRR